MANKTFSLRKVKPSSSNKNYIKTTFGGNNKAIAINSKTGWVLPNCVGYCWGTLIEMFGSTKISPTNACNWYSQAHGCDTSTTTPKLGSIACWGAYGNNSAGHVATVIAIGADDITVAQSNYGGTEWETVKCSKMSSGGYKSHGGNTAFQGFIYPPNGYICDEEESASSKNSGVVNVATTVATAQKDSHKGTFTADCNVHMRSGCGTNYSSLVVIPKGTKIYCDAGYYTPTDNVNGYYWGYMRTTVSGRSYTGFVWSGYFTRYSDKIV